VKNRVALIALMRERTLARTSAEWIALMEDAGVPCGPINTLDQVFADPQVRSRGMEIEMPHPRAETVRLVANPIRMSESPVQYRRPPPGLGEHTGEVLSDWLGLDAADVAQLKEKKAI
jgi:crotonobetainyl-CoA:carnitine CoA-transferase CaiB-like acyl-CoA transferase